MKRTIISTSLVAVFLSFGNQGLAAPSISSVSGTVSAGQTVTVNGSGFGSKSPAKPFLWAPFSGSLAPSSLGVVTAWHSTENMGYNSSEGAGGGGSAKSTNSSGTWAMSIRSSGFNWNDYGQHSYIFRKTKRNFETPVGGFNWKVWRMWPESVGTLPDTYISTHNGCAYTEGIMSTCKWFDASTFIGSSGRYNTEELILSSNSSSSSADGTLNLYNNGASAGSMSGMQLKNGAAVMPLNFVVHGVKANVTFDSSSAYWADDVYVDNTWARVMICPGSSWNSRGSCEIQIPSAWSASSISVAANTGVLASGSSAYLYVVDANGNVSPGYQVRIGSGTSTTPITAPAGLRINSVTQ